MEGVNESSTGDNRSATESRLKDIESALKIDQRIATIEKSIRVKPWWKTTSIAVALISLIIPATTFINGYFTNLREESRQIIDQQNKIRQTYLDRVLKQGISEREQQQIFKLLTYLSADPELKKWAQDELSITTRKIDSLGKLISALQKQLLYRSISYDSLLKQNSSEKKIPNQDLVRLRFLSRQNRISQQKIKSLKERIGDEKPDQWVMDNDFSLKIVDQDKKPIVNTKFLILDAGTGKTIHEVVSDEMGLIFFESPPGFYVISSISDNQSERFVIPASFSSFIPDSGPGPVTPVMTFKR